MRKRFCSIRPTDPAVPPLSGLPPKELPDGCREARRCSDSLLRYRPAANRRCPDDAPDVPDNLGSKQLRNRCSPARNDDARSRLGYSEDGQHDPDAGHQVQVWRGRSDDRACSTVRLRTLPLPRRHGRRPHGRVARGGESARPDAGAKGVDPHRERYFDRFHRDGPCAPADEQARKDRRCAVARQRQHGRGRNYRCRRSSLAKCALRFREGPAVDRPVSNGGISG